jgi:hypothetical protein
MKIFPDIMRRILLIALPLMLLSCNKYTVSTESLLDEMIDRENIARIPAIPFTLKQFSSYDRESVSPDQPGWFANSDRTMFIRKEVNQGREEYVMMDAKGPGAVVRIWMTFAGKDSGTGTLRIYFDDQPEPTIQGTAFEILSGSALVGEPLATSVSDLSLYENRGHNLYLPLPYGTRCKITYESQNITTPGNKRNNGESVYYNINYRTYPLGTKILTFSQNELGKATEKIELVQEQLRNRNKDIDGLRLKTAAISDDLMSGEHLIIDIPGSAAVRYIRLKIDADDLPQALRSTIVEGEFDGEKCIWCPAGDFFGTGYQIRHLNTWYSKVDEDGTMEVFWIMPFEKSAKLTISNLGEANVKLQGEVGWSGWKWDDRSMHFRTSWHQYTNIFTREGFASENPGSPFDLNYVELTGEGTYVGDGLTLFNTSYIWWGEGDEKIYVDEERFPSHFGTGTEDYYGYAWGGRSMQFSNHPLIAQPDASGNFRPGYVVNLRYRSLDVIPFSERLKVDMELWHWHTTWMNYAPVSYYYMRPGGRTNVLPDKEGALAKVAIKSTDIIPNALSDGKIEAENMEFHNSCGNKRGSMSINPFADLPLSGNLQVMWNDGTPGDTIFFSFTSPATGYFQLTGHFSSGPGFGTFNAYLNEKPIFREFSLFAEKRSNEILRFDKVYINEGVNTLSFVIKQGKTDNHLFALDRIDLVRNK